MNAESLMFISKFFFRVTAFYLISSLLLGIPCFADEAPQSERLNEISLKISSLQAEQKELSANMAANEKLSLQLSQEIMAVQESLKNNSGDLEDLRKDTSRLTSEISDYAERYNDLAAQSAARLKAMYMLGGGQQMALTLTSEGKASLGQVTHYMNAIRSHEISNLAELKRLSSERSKRIEELEVKKQEVLSLQEKAQQQQEELKKKQLGLEAAKSNLKKQRANKTKILSELRAEALRIETVLSSLAVSETPRLPAEDSTNESAKSPDARSLDSVQAAEIQMQGLGDKFLAPVNGTIVTRFGSQVSDGLEQLSKSKGLGFAVPEGQEVRAVGAGKASFVGTLGTYGSVIIIDHGNRTHTLYSQLGSTMVVLGQEVRQGDVIAKTTTATAGRAFNLYFELRKEGKAIDPKPFLR